MTATLLPDPLWILSSRSCRVSTTATGWATARLGTRVP